MFPIQVGGLKVLNLGKVRSQGLGYIYLSAPSLHPNFLGWFCTKSLWESVGVAWPLLEGGGVAWLLLEGGGVA